MTLNEAKALGFVFQRDVINRDSKDYYWRQVPRLAAKVREQGRLTFDDSPHWCFRSEQAALAALKEAVELGLATLKAS